MTHDANPIDISHLPELARIADEVAATKTPRELRRENKTVAVIMPVPPAGKAKQHRSGARNIRLVDSFPTACEESCGQCRRASMPNINGWQRPLQRLQAPIDLSDGLGIRLEEDGVKPRGRGGGDVALGIIEEDDLLWLHP